MAKRLGSIGIVMEEVKGKEEAPRKILREIPNEFQEEIEWN